jgi:Rieske Fe-S protein
VGFAVGIVCILVGLIVSWPAVAVGAAITLIFGFLWIRDVTRGYRTIPEPEPDGAGPAEPAPAIPAHEGPPAMPETPPAEAARYPRSKFLEGATLGLGAAIGAVVTIPAVGFAVVPAFVDQGNPDIDLGPIDNFPQGEWMITHFNLRPEEGEVARRVAYIRYNGLADNEPSFTVISNRCAHLGCPVQPGGLIQPDKTKDQKASGGQEIQLTPVLGLSSFTCPCHGGSYDSEGNRTAGPPVRALDRWTYEIKNGNLVLITNYSVSTVEGTGAQAVIHKYQLTGPGQHVDGPEQIFYPWQPPT